ncbi:hypothetical protein VTI28DRAFT_4708 [Corynascus sepedonium]
MLAVRASLAEINSHSGDKPLEVVCLNEPKGTVLGGTAEKIEELAKMLEAGGFKCFHLDVDFAFHSAQTDPLLDDLEEMARTGAVFYPPNLPIISPLLDRVIFDEKTINASYIRRATRETVNFLAAVETASRMSTVDETMVISSIHADVAWTPDKYLINKLRPNDKKEVSDIDISDLTVREGLVAHKNTNVPQLIQVSIWTADINSL